MARTPATSPRPLRAAERIVPPSGRHVPGGVRILSVLVVVALVLAGVWFTGGVVTDDFALAQVLTGVWFALAGLVAVVVGLRWRALAVPVVGAYALTLLVVAGYLGLSSTQQRVVKENVVVSGALTLARGEFRSQAHETTGAATLLERADGSRVVTFTGFVTDPGPDLRVYLVPGDGESVEGGVDLGALKGNEGDQQYEVPAEVSDGQAGSVVVWCRAFTVAFGAATLDRA